MSRLFPTSIGVPLFSVVAARSNFHRSPHRSAARSLTALALPLAMAATIVALAAPPTPAASLEENGASAHWALQPLRQLDLPKLSPSQKIDRLVRNLQDQRGVTLSQPADARTRLRRLTYVLTGLPAPYETLTHFAEEANDREAYLQAVDRLLASPAFGEHWGRHWLDIARYADTKGYVFQENREYEGAYKYRDWVIQAFNDDMPYDQFVTWQIAGDHVAASIEDPRLAAFGFLTLGRRFLNRRHEIINDRIDVVSRGLLGLTVACARCHDHKFDPISAAEYYGVYGIFASSEETVAESAPPYLVDKPEPRDAPILIRGNPRDHGKSVPRHFLPTLLNLGDAASAPPPQGSGRIEMVRAITDPTNPLTARVWANRVWGQLTGEYLVRTPSDFGVRCERPEQVELLDYLASLLIESGWSTKSLIRAIVGSQVFGQASLHRDDCFAIDPENRLLWRANLQRLRWESLRDAVLHTSGHLDRTVGGPPVNLFAEPTPPRRTIYGKVERQNLPLVMRMFDFASPDEHVPRRHETTVPLQSLYLMNSPFLLGEAIRIAEQVEAGTEPDWANCVDVLYRSILRRLPLPEERAWSIDYLQEAEAERSRFPEHAADHDFPPSARLAQVLLMSNEFCYVD